MYFLSLKVDMVLYVSHISTVVCLMTGIKHACFGRFYV